MRTLSHTILSCPVQNPLSQISKGQNESSVFKKEYFLSQKDSMTSEHITSMKNLVLCWELPSCHAARDNSLLLTPYLYMMMLFSNLVTLHFLCGQAVHHVLVLRQLQHHLSYLFCRNFLFCHWDLVIQGCHLIQVAHLVLVYL